MQPGKSTRLLRAVHLGAHVGPAPLGATTGVASYHRGFFVRPYVYTLDFNFVLQQMEDDGHSHVKLRLSRASVRLAQQGFRGRALSTGNKWTS